MSPYLSIINLTKRYADRTVIDAISLDINQGELFSLLGPSGAGKSTILNAVVGLTAVDSGKIILAGKSILDVPVGLRNIGMVFQNHSLFPTMTVRQNIAFPLDARRSRGILGVMRDLFRTNEDDGTKRKIDDLLRLVKLQGHGDKLPEQLSGGEQQRVALARTLIFDPDLLCLDEPLGALDKNLRHLMQEEIRSLQRRLGKTMLYVTHDQTEAFTVSDRIAIINEGKILQIGGPEEIYARPTSRFVACFLGECNIFPIEQIEVAGDEFMITLTGGTRFIRPKVMGREKSTLLGVRPEWLQISPVVPRPRCSFVGKVSSRTFVGSQVHVAVEMAGGHGMIVLVPSFQSALVPPAGESLTMTYASENILLFE